LLKVTGTTTAAASNSLSNMNKVNNNKNTKNNLFSKSNDHVSYPQPVLSGYPLSDSYVIPSPLGASNTFKKT